MISKQFSELLAVIASDELVAVRGDAQIVAPVTESAREVQTGGVFVARQGAQVDGHDFIPQAIENGAVAIVGEHALADLPEFDSTIAYAQVKNPMQILGHLASAYHGFPSRKLIVFGVTGTDGKTTTSTFLHSILNVATSGKAGYISTVAADFGKGAVDTGFHVTSPHAQDVQAYLAKMVANGMTHCVLEMTSHGLAQGRLNGVEVDVAVMTNIQHEHLDFHGSFENYRSAKARMFEMLAMSYRKLDQFGNAVPKISVINNDDPNADYFAQIPADHVLTYSIDTESDFQAADIRYDVDSIRFALRDRWAEGADDEDLVRDFAIHLLGEFNVLNAVAAIVASHRLIDDGVLGASMIWDGLQAVESIIGRMQRIDEGQDFTAIVDFAHTPNALKNALNASRKMLLDGGRLIAVFGSAGLRDVEKRRLMAEISAELADMTVLTAEDPRTESLDQILQMMAEGCLSKGGIEGETFIRVPDRGEAIYQACLMAKAGDIVIACGKGHEQSMCFGTVEHLWDDGDAMRSALRGDPLRTLPTASHMP